MEGVKDKSKQFSEFVKDEKYYVIKKINEYLPEEQRAQNTPAHTLCSTKFFFHRYLPVTAFTEETFRWALDSLCKYAGEYIKKNIGEKRMYIDSLDAIIEKDPRGLKWYGQPNIQFVLRVDYEIFDK